MRRNTLRLRHVKERGGVGVSKHATDFCTGKGPAVFPLRRKFFCLFLIGMLGMLHMLAGCSKNPIRKNTMVFGLDDVFKKNIAGQDAAEIHGQWKERALELARNGDLKEAVEAFEKYIEQDPENYFGFNGLAVCYKRMKDPAAAMINFDRALEFAEDPSERAKVLGNIGNLYLNANQPQAALGYYKEAASINKNHPHYLILIAYTFLKLGDPERARKVLSEAEENISQLKQMNKSDQGRSYYYMARCILGVGEEDRSRVYRYLKLALEADPEHVLARLKKDVNNGQSLFYTLKDDEDLERLLAEFDNKGIKSVWEKADKRSIGLKSLLGAQ